MTHEACPRCGGRAHLETETRDRRAGTVTRRYQCDSCGRAYTVKRTPTALSGRAAATRAIAIVPVALLALWIALRNPVYSDRAHLYDTLSSVLEAFRHPLWAAVCAVSAALLLALARARRTEVSEISDRALDLHVREEPGGRLAFIAPGVKAPLGRDLVVTRRPGEEAALLTRLSDLATRSTSFGVGAAGSPEDEATRELHREIYSIGLALSDLLLGQDDELRDLIFDLPGDHLLLRIQPGLAHLPWELLVPRPGAEYLWQRFHVGRQVMGDRAAATAERSSSGPLRILVIANPEFDDESRALPYAEREADELAELAATEPERLRVTRRNPRSAEELRVAVGEGFDVVHFAGHTVDREGRSGWVLTGGGAVDPASAIASSGSPPALVFANACGSGPRARLSDWTTDGPLSIVASGAGAYIGTLWELADPHAAHVSRVFYKSLLAGRSLGQSLTAARGSHMGVSPFGWANYVLYGDPAARLLARP